MLEKNGKKSSIVTEKLLLKIKKRTENLPIPYPSALLAQK